jgi:hypothetical protein
MHPSGDTAVRPSRLAESSGEQHEAIRCRGMSAHLGRADRMGIIATEIQDVLHSNASCRTE